MQFEDFYHLNSIGEWLNWLIFLLKSHIYLGIFYHYKRKINQQLKKLSQSTYSPWLLVNLNISKLYLTNSTLHWFINLTKQYHPSLYLFIESAKLFNSSVYQYIPMKFSDPSFDFSCVEIIFRTMSSEKELISVFFR